MPARVHRAKTLSKRVAFSGVPASKDRANARDMVIECFMYDLCRWYDVVNMSEMGRLFTRTAGDRGFVIVEFEKRKDAQVVCGLYNDIVAQGSKISVMLSRPPMKFPGASWDSSHSHARYQPRDFGSANNTNFVSVRIASLASFVTACAVGFCVEQQWLIWIRCKRKSIANGHWAEQIVGFGFRSASIEFCAACSRSRVMAVDRLWRPSTLPHLSFSFSLNAHP
jgi:hypothetical protein